MNYVLPYRSLIYQREKKIESLPYDLIVEILSRLPSKSIARFRCVSKLWKSIFDRPYFSELFYTFSQARPRLLLLVEPDYKRNSWLLYSSSQPHNPTGKSLVVGADFIMKFPTNSKPLELSCGGYVSGLISFYGKENSNYDFYYDRDFKYGICNPTTRQFAILPNLEGYKRNFLGFDPIGKQFKLLSMSYRKNVIVTLGSEEMIWRNIHCDLSHEPSWREGICINGVVYYIAKSNFGGYDEIEAMIVCFDVRSETFKFIPASFLDFWGTMLVNYKGKLAGISWEHEYEYDNDDGTTSTFSSIELSMWVQKDAEKDEWSNHVYNISDDKFCDGSVFVAGVTSTGEIVLSYCGHGQNYASKPFYVFYFNPERKTLKTIEIYNRRVFNNWSRVHIFVDHVECLKFNMMNVTSTSPPELKLSTLTSIEEDHHQKLDQRMFESNNKGTISITPLEKEWLKPTRTAKKKHHQKQDCHSFESVNKFDALRLLNDHGNLSFNIMESASEEDHHHKQENKGRKRPRTSKRGRRQKQDRSRFATINKAKRDFLFTGFVRVLSRCWLCILLILIIIS